jgi:hypothetical protein
MQPTDKIEDSATLGNIALAIGFRACGYTARQPDAAPPWARAFAGSFRDGTVGTADNVARLYGNSLGAFAGALQALARLGLIPGYTTAPGTAYLIPERGGITGKPNPVGRLALARAAGVEVSTTAVSRAEVVTLGSDGAIEALALDPDKRPVTWDDLKGVAVTLTHHDGVVVKLWVSAGEINERKKKAGQQGAWTTDAIGMACSKAVSILVSRGAIPQVSLLDRYLRAPAALQAPAVLALPHPQPEPRALQAPQPPPAPPAEPQAPQAAPPVEADAQGAPEAEAPQEAPSAPESGEGEAQAQAEAAPDYDRMWYAFFSDCTEHPRLSDVHPDDLAEAVKSARRKSIAAGRLGPPELTGAVAAKIGALVPS